MAHFAELDENNTVLRVIVVANEELLDANGDEDEAKGIAFCQGLLGGTWKQTSYNGNFRKRYAGTGYTYDSELDAFITPKPYPSWTLNESTADWDAPIARPDDENLYVWNEADQQWDAVELP